MSNPSDAVSDSEIKNTQAGSQTGGAQSGAGSAAQAAGAQTGQAQAGSGASYQSAGAEVTSDVGQAEAYLLNMKRLVGRELDTDAHLQAQLTQLNNRLIRNAEDFDGQVRSVALQALTLGQTALQNAVALANRVNNASVDLDTRIKQNAVDGDNRTRGNDETHDKNVDGVAHSERERTIRGGDAGDVIRWAALAENPIFQDAISAAVAKAAQDLKAAAAAK